MLIRIYCFIFLVFAFISCTKIENVPGYELSLSKTNFYFESENISDTIFVNKSPRGLIIYHVIGDDGHIEYEHEYEKYLEIIEEKPDKIVFALKRADFNFSIAVHILAEGLVQATDTAWYKGRFNLDFSNKIFYLADEDFDSYLKYYDMQDKSEHSLRYFEDNYRLFDVCISKGLIASEARSGFTIEDILGNTYLSEEDPGVVKFINDSGDFVTNDNVYIKGNGVTYSIQSNDTLEKYMTSYNDIGIRVTKTDTIIFFIRPNSSWKHDMISLYRNGEVIEIDELPHADIQDISISSDGSTTYFSHGWSPSDIYRLSLFPPYTMELVLDNINVVGLNSNADGSSLIFNHEGSLEIYEHSTGNSKVIENVTLTQSSNVIWD